MMKNINIIIGLLVLVVISSCKRMEDPVFDKNPSIRMTEAIENARNAIKAHPGGWLIQYYPHSGKNYGGFNIFAVFNSDSEVTLTSDVNTDEIRSTFDIVPEGGPILTFNGYNKVIHMFSEPGADSGIGPADSGMQGDFEFIIIEATEEQITLKGKKSGNMMYMVPIESVTDENVDVDDIIDGYQEATTFFGEFGVFKMQRPNGAEETLIQNIHNFRLSSDANAAALTFRVTPEGLALHDTYEIDGVSLDIMPYVEPSDEYEFGYYSGADGQVKIFPVTTPMNVWFRTNTWAMRYSGLGAEGQYWWDQGRTRFSNFGYTLNYVDIGDFSAQTAPGVTGFGAFLTVNGQASTGYFVYNMVPVDGTVDEIRVTFAGSYYSTSAFDLAYWNNAIRYLVQMLNDRTFKITSDALDRPDVILLTDKSDPTNTIELIRNGDIYDPFNN